MYRQKCKRLESEKSNKDKEIELYKEELEKLKESDNAEEASMLELENSNILLKSQLSEKNREIASLEKELAATNHRLLLSNIDARDKEIESLKNKIRELEEEKTAYEQEREIKETEMVNYKNESESQLKDLQDFVNVVQRLATIQSREEVIDFCMCW